MESRMERMSSSVQSWVEEHKLATIGGVSAAVVGAYSRRQIHGRKKALTLAVLGGAALAHRYYNNKRSKNKDDLDYDFYSQLPAATEGGENERWSW